LREKESIARKIKKAKNIRGKPFERDEKPWLSKGGISLTLLSSLLCEEWKFSLYNNGVLPKREAFSLPHFLTNALPFSLMFSPSSCPNGLTTCSSYSTRNVARYKRQVSNHDSSI